MKQIISTLTFAAITLVLASFSHAEINSNAVAGFQGKIGTGFVRLDDELNRQKNFRCSIAVDNHGFITIAANSAGITPTGHGAYPNFESTGDDGLAIDLRQQVKAVQLGATSILTAKSTHRVLAGWVMLEQTLRISSMSVELKTQSTLGNQTYYQTARCDF
jgi:hypothetical protein